MFLPNPIECKTPRWTRIAYTYNGLEDLRTCAKLQNLNLIETEIKEKTNEK